MLNDIRLHVDPDEQRQCEHETVFAKTMRERDCEIVTSLGVPSINFHFLIMKK